VSDFVRLPEVIQIGDMIHGQPPPWGVACRNCGAVQTHPVCDPICDRCFAMEMEIAKDLAPLDSGHKCAECDTPCPPDDYLCDPCRSASRTTTESPL
jgi:hypothetical protein